MKQKIFKYLNISIVALCVLALAGVSGWMLFRGGSFGGALHFKSLNFFTRSADRSASDRPDISGSQTFTHPAYGFSFQYPEGFRPESFSEGEGEMILVSGPNAGESFQIYITPFDEEGPLTLERIKKDIPAIAAEEPQIVFIGQKSEIPAYVKASAGRRNPK